MITGIAMIFFSVVGFIAAMIVLFLFAGMVGIIRYRQGFNHVSERVYDDLKYANEVVQVETMVPCPVCQKLNPAGEPCSACGASE